MNSEESGSTDPRISAILETLTQLIAGNWAARATTTCQGDPLDHVVDQLNHLADQLSTRHTMLAEIEPRFEEFLDLISGMAALDFSRKAHIGTSGSILDAMAFGINMLSEELAASTVSRAYVDNIIESLLDALVVIDYDGTIKTVNKAASRLFGYPKADLLAQPIAILLAQPEIAPQIVDALAREASIDIEETICRTIDGRDFPASFATSAMPYSNGQIQRFVCIIRDLSEQKKAEESLRHSIAQEETIRAQAIALAELSTPLIPLSEHVVVMPLIGAVDSRRAQQVLETLLQGIAQTSAEIAILDITGVPVVDTQVANALIHAAQAVKLLGTQVMLTGISPEVAQTLVGLGVDLRDITTRSSLQSGIASVLRQR